MPLPRLSPKVTVSVVFVLAMFMAIMDITIVNVSLPAIARQFHVRPDAIDTVVVGFLVSLAVFIPASGWLGDRLGSKRVFLAALAIFTVASALCGVAQSLGQLVAFRILQGVGGGLLTPVGMAMLFRTFPPHERVRAARILIVPTAFAPALGPVLGGVLVTELSWRWVFYVNLPIGIVGFVFGWLFLHEHREPEPGRFDLPGFVLAGIGFSALMYALSEGPIKGWGSGLIVGMGLAGVALLAVLVRVELRRPAPMLDLRQLRDGLFRTTSLVMLIAAAGFLGVLYLVALFFQDGLGRTALVSGLSTFPEALGVMAGAQIVGRLYPSIGPRRLVIGGLVGVGACMALMTLISAPSQLWWMRVLMFGMGLAMGHVFVPVQTAAFATVKPAAMGRASTLFNAGRQLGSALGVAILSTVLSAIGVTHLVRRHLHPDLTAYHGAFLAGAGLVAIAVLLAFAINDRAAAPTMRRAPATDYAADESGLTESLSA